MKYTLKEYPDSRRPGFFYYGIPELSLISHVVLPNQKRELQAVVDCLNKNPKEAKRGESMSMQSRVHRMDLRLRRAYAELERLDGEHGGRAIMPYDVAQPLKWELIHQMQLNNDREVLQ